MSDRHLWPAPAKLNLFLHVLGRRGDGYHEIQTVFQFLDHGDALGIEPRADGCIVRRVELPGVTEERDLCLRAARLLQTESGAAQGAEITLDKRLPLGSGLGGGSSDAATVLLVLNRLWGLDWPLERLARLGLALGADVPVFVRGHAAFAEGVGERLIPVEPPESCYLVVVPPLTVSTAEVFDAAELTRNTRPITIRDFSRGGLRNDLEPVVLARYPAVAEAKRWLDRQLDRQGGRNDGARLTGSGACLFAAFPDESAALVVLRQMPQGLTGFVARGVNRSPLHAALGIAGGT
jgi:4-diphosphocytidyl-2-C-methyl-D-erythritol kinase